MIALGASQALEGVATSATTVTYTVSGLLLDTSTPPIAQGYSVLAQGQLASSAGSLYNPGSSNTALISSIHLMNTGGSAETVVLYVTGTTSADQICTMVIPAGGWATYDAGNGWTVYSASGLIVGTAGSPGGVGTPDASTIALTAGTQIVVAGTKVQLATNQLFVGSRYQFSMGIIKTTAAGAATWTAKVCFGTAGTNADGAIATFTSGTNTGAIDQAILIVDVLVTALGATATASCRAFYVNTLTNATGLGSIPLVPGSTATFNSTSTSPFIHVDITMGTSAVCTAVGSAERLV